MSTTSKTTTTTSAKKMNVTRFCQTAELSSGYTRLMKQKYPMESHTYEEWEEIYKAMISRKVTS